MLLIPKLRFPDYINQKEWDMKSMETIFNIRNGYTPSKANPRFWDNGNIPWFRMEDIRLNGHILSDSIQHVTPEAIKGTGLFPAYSIIVATTATIGEHALIIVDSLANQQFTFLTKRKSFEKVIDMLYFHYYMFIVDDWCKKNTNSGGLLSVNMSAFKHLMIPYPIRLSEQQKIAECLSSVDSYISSINEKVEQLKAHKKSLLQKLFPQEGNIIPKCRFPEFQENSAWEKREFKEVIKVNSGRDYKHLSSGNIPVYGTGGYMLSVDGKLSDQDAVGIGRKGTIDRPQYLKAPFWTVDTLFFLTNCDGYDIEFIYYLSQIIQWKKYGEQTGVPSLSKISIENLEVIVPTNIAEQKRIAETFSSLDKKIELLKKKSTLLEEHKKGLMQQLFPTNH